LVAEKVPVVICLENAEGIDEAPRVTSIELVPGRRLRRGKAAAQRQQWTTYQLFMKKMNEPSTCNQAVRPPFGGSSVAVSCFSKADPSLAKRCVWAVWLARVEEEFLPTSCCGRSLSASLFSITQIRTLEEKTEYTGQFMTDTQNANKPKNEVIFSLPCPTISRPLAKRYAMPWCSKFSICHTQADNRFLARTHDVELRNVIFLCPPSNEAA
jgi:hypothetical protein